MKPISLIKCLLTMKHTGLGKSPVSIAINKLKQQVRDGEEWRWQDHTMKFPYELIKDTPEGHDLMERLGSCDRCGEPNFERYDAPSGSRYCSIDCALENGDIWNVCSSCYEETADGFVVKNLTYCSEECFWDEVTNPRGSITEVTSFLQRHPDLNPYRIRELQGVVDPETLLDDSEAILSELYGV